MQAQSCPSSVVTGTTNGFRKLKLSALGSSLLCSRPRTQPGLPPSAPGLHYLPRLLETTCPWGASHLQRAGRQEPGGTSLSATRRRSGLPLTPALNPEQRESWAPEFQIPGGQAASTLRLSPLGKRGDDCALVSVWLRDLETSELTWEVEEMPEMEAKISFSRNRAFVRNSIIAQRPPCSCVPGVRSRFLAMAFGCNFLSPAPL
ncbi:uncharacterized protein LOC110744026 isoform X1 [Papio anubis]|uniref:uncharacterized protein LOC110744026 isoform X1 n=1 Tax=Papio anubis TaxID=9555 RepID=UPI0012AD6CFF|nr:uncharacterized protein LOC110744026 isoform X1 [Papio anubis]